MAKIFCGLLLMTGCLSTSPVHRTDLTNWKTVEMPFQGVTLELPTKAFHFQMHQHPNFLCDSVWMLSVSIDKETIDQRQHPCIPSSENPLSTDKDYMAWAKWSHDIHLETATWESGNRREYRHDIPNPDGSIVRTHITYAFSWFSKNEQEQDEAAIKRIIASVKPIMKSGTQQTSAGDVLNAVPEK